MVIYRLTLIPLDKAMNDAELVVLHTWYANYVAIRVTSRRNAKLLHALM